MTKLIITAVLTFLVVVFAVQNLHEITVNVPVKGPVGIDAVVLMGFCFLAGLLTALLYQLMQKHNHNKVRNTIVRRLEESGETLEEAD